MPDMDFYMVLPSNASPDIYPTNKTSNFKVQLAQRMELNGNWQVALLEILYPNTLNHVTHGNNWIKIFKPYTSDLEEVQHAEAGPRYETSAVTPQESLVIFTPEKKYFVKTGHYSNIDYFLGEVKDAFRALTYPPKHGLEIDYPISTTQDGRFYSKPFQHYPEASYEFSPHLAMQLGLSKPGPHRADKSLVGIRPIDLTLGVPSQMFVYMDIIQDQIVGHTRAPLLRSVGTSIDAKFGSMTMFRCEHPIYYDLKTKNFDTIEINIRTGAGDFLPFHHGTSTLVCHFRQRS